MSKIIQQTATVQRKQLENVKRSHSAEMRAINDSFVQRKDELKANNESAIIDIQNENHKQLDTENQKKEKVLTVMKKNLDDTQFRTEKQLADLKTHSYNSTVDLQTKSSLDRDRIAKENESFIGEINDKFNEKSRDIRDQGNRRIETMDDSAKMKFSKLRDEHSQKVQKQTHDFSRRYTTDEQKYKEFKDVQDNTFKKERLATNQRQQKDMVKITSEHSAVVEKKDKEFKVGLKEQDLFLEKKWQDTMKSHEVDFKNLDDLHKKVVSKVKTDMTNEVSQIVKRSDDKFYQFSELNPVLTQHPDHVEIKVKVPEHSKQDLQLTTNNKEVVLVYNRRYQDTNKNMLGSAKLHRVESFTSRINVDGFLDSRSVKSSYDGDTMTYTIKKA